MLRHQSDNLCPFGTRHNKLVRWEGYNVAETDITCRENNDYVPTWLSVANKLLYIKLPCGMEVNYNQLVPSLLEAFLEVIRVLDSVNHSYYL